MPNKVFTKRIRISNKVSESTSSVCTSFLLSITQKIDEKRYTRTQMFVEYVVVEASISDGETGKLAGVSIRITAALNGSSNESMLKQLLVKKPCMATKISNEVTNFGTDIGIRMRYERFEVSVYVGIVNWLVKILINACKLAHQGERIDGKRD